LNKSRLLPLQSIQCHRKNGWLHKSLQQLLPLVLLVRLLVALLLSPLVLLLEPL
jgi:hypothetical protein